MGSMISSTARTLDRDEVARFATLAGEWWDENGPFKPLHRINPVRLTYIRDQLCRHFGRDAKGPASLARLNILDIGCGGGLVCEPLSRLGAEVTGIDPELSTTGGTSEGRFIAKICPQVVEFGPVNATIHKIDEHVAVADIEPLMHIYRRTMENLLL